jgi:hypothetical protein
MPVLHILGVALCILACFAGSLPATLAPADAAGVAATFDEVLLFDADRVPDAAALDAMFARPVQFDSRAALANALSTTRAQHDAAIAALRAGVVRHIAFDADHYRLSDRTARVTTIISCSERTVIELDDAKHTYRERPIAPEERAQMLAMIGAVPTPAFPAGYAADAARIVGVNETDRYRLSLEVRSAVAASYTYRFDTPIPLPHCAPPEAGLLTTGSYGIDVSIAFLQIAAAGVGAQATASVAAGPSGLPTDTLFRSDLSNVSGIVARRNVAAGVEPGAFTIPAGYTAAN